MTTFPISAMAAGASQIKAFGDSVAVLTSYPSWDGLQLHSLTAATAYVCSACRQSHESTMVATGEDSLVCPGCFSYLIRDGATVSLPEQRVPNGS